MAWRLPDTYHSAGHGRGTATLKFYEGRDVLGRGGQVPPSSLHSGLYLIGLAPRVLIGQRRIRAEVRSAFKISTASSGIRVLGWPNCFPHEESVLSDIFLSYTHQDQQAAELVYEHLVEKGRSVFLDRRRLEAGRKWEADLLAELKVARCVLVLWSKASIESDWVRKEADSGYIRNRLVQALLEPVQPREPFASLQAADLVGWNGDPAPGLATLADAIDRVLRLPAGAPEIAAEELDQASAAPGHNRSP
jgi:hypothetical protein